MNENTNNVSNQDMTDALELLAIKLDENGNALPTEDGEEFTQDALDVTVH